MGQHLDQHVHVIVCEMEAVEAETGAGREAGQNLPQGLPSHPTALAHPQALQPSHTAQRLHTQAYLSSL